MADYGVISPNKIVTALISLLAFFLPFEAVGIEVGTYQIAFPVIIGAVLTAFLIGFGWHSVNSRLCMLFALVGWFFLTVVFRFPIQVYGLSLVIFFLMSFPITVNLKYRVDRNKILASLSLGFYITIFVTSMEILEQILGFQVISELVASVVNNARSAQFIDLTRAKAFMFEPAHLAIYFCFVYVIFDIYESRRSEFFLAKFLCVLGLIFTFSLSGVIILSGYIIARMTRRASSGIRFGRGISKRTVIRIIMTISVFLVLVLVFRSFLFDYFSLIMTRFSAISRSLIEGNYVGSIGSRSNALSVMFNYWGEEWPNGTIIGTGYANHETWLTDNYAHLGILSAFARGQVNSIFAAVGLSTGVIGLGLYILFLIFFIGKSFKGVKFEIWVLVIGVQMAYGVLVGYVLWHNMLILSLAYTGLGENLTKNSAS